MNLLRLLKAAALVCGLALSGISLAQAATTNDLFLKDDARCTECHDEADAPELLAIGKTRHGVKADSRTPTCTSCHGKSDKHVEYKGKDKPPKPDTIFGKKASTSHQDKSEACLTCHKNDSKSSHWEGSVHQTRDVACSSCHLIHVAKDKVLDKKSEAEVCFACHKEQRVQANKPSRHPIPEGKVTCSDCHNAHGSTGPSLMKRDSVVETCYTCHMEKRGPFVRNHQPVNDDCSICHNPHGTTTASMLKSKPPFLCQTCHTPHGPIQPSVANGPGGNPGWWNGSTMTQGRSCMNCHTQVHGSNNPSTALPTPQRLFR